MSFTNHPLLLGNGYTGKMDGFDLPNIYELSISNNRIRGFIPTSLNNQTMDVFDISNNKIKGALDVVINSAYPNSTFKANVNRLSGRLYVSSINKFLAPNVLDSNVMSCGTLPANDVDIDSYSCGSSSLDNACYTWCAYLSAFLIVVIVCLYGKHPYIAKHYSRWQLHISMHADIMRDVKRNYPNIELLLSSLRQLAMYMV